MKQEYKTSHLGKHKTYIPTSFQHGIPKPGENEAISSYTAVTNTWQASSTAPSSPSQPAITGTNAQSLQQKSAVYVKPKQLAIVFEKVKTTQYFVWNLTEKYFLCQ